MPKVHDGDREKVLNAVNEREKKGGVPFHITTKQYGRNNTPLANTLHAFVNGGFLTLVHDKDLPRAPDGTSLANSGETAFGFTMTEKGKLALGALQMKSYIERGRKTKPVVRELLPVIEKQIGAESVDMMLRILTAGASHRHIITKANESALRMLNRLEFTRRKGSNDDKYFEVTVRGAIFGEAAMKIRNENPENKMNALLVSQLFAEEMVVDVDVDTSNPVIDALKEKSLIEEHVRDEAFIYYRPSTDGLLVLKEGQAIIKEGDVSQVEYAQTGRDVVAARGGVDVFPLHWDDMHDNDVPLIDAIYDALDTAKPKEDNGLNQALGEAVERAASVFREKPTASQLKSVAAEILKNEGIEFEAAQLDHAATSYRMANNDNNNTVTQSPRP